MREGFLLLGVGIISTTLSFAQVRKQFSVEDHNEIEKVDLDFSVNNGSCYIKPNLTSEILTVYGSQDYDSYSHSFNKELVNKVCKINLALEDDKSAGLSKSISYRVFGNSKEENSNLWKLFLSPEKIYDLNLQYGIGMADIDLSGLAIDKVKINTGSADVNIGYPDGKSNTVSMDTFYVKVDLGSVKVQNLNLSKSRNIIAEIGFGDLLLDFSDINEISSNIHGSVGAGNLIIVLPREDTPAIIKINDSWLCKVDMAKSYKKIANNTFVNAAYSDDAPNLLSFDLDVSMGKIIFKENPSNK